MSSAVKEADKYLRECKNDNPERIKKTQMMKGRLIAIPMRSGDVANKAFMQKKKEVLGDRFKIFNYYSMDTQSIVFRREKYKDSVPPSKHSFSTNRTANESIAMMAMAASGKYTLDDIMEPDRFVKEKQQIFDEVTKRLVRGNPEDQEWTTRILHEGRKASEILVDDKARQIDFSKVDILDKEYCKLLQFGMVQFDAYQECSHCAAETLKIVNNDKTEDRPVYNDYNKYCIWCEKRLTALGDLCQGYNNIQEYAAEMMEDQVRPEESACSLLAESALIKYGEQKLAECQKKNSDKLFHEWYDGHLNIELKETRYKLAGENSRMLEDLQGDPKTTHALFGKLMDGTLLEPQTVNGKKIEGLTFSIDKDTFKVSFTGKPFTNQELKDIAFFSQPGDKILGQAIKDINTAKESVLFGSSEYKNAGNAMTELEKVYKAMNELPENASEEQKIQAYASVKEKSREAQQKIGLYFNRKTAQNLMNGNADPKTQKRIDAMKLASGVAKKLEVEMKQMEAKLNEDKLNARDAKEMEEKEKN